MYNAFQTDIYTYSFSLLFHVRDICKFVLLLLLERCNKKEARPWYWWTTKCKRYDDGDDRLKEICDDINNNNKWFAPKEMHLK